jgi:hypothetical protein
MAKKSEPPKPIVWGVYKIAAKVVWLGNVEATDEAAAIEKGAAEFKVAAKPADGDTAAIARREARSIKHTFQVQLPAVGLPPPPLIRVGIGTPLGQLDNKIPSARRLAYRAFGRGRPRNVMNWG